MQSFTLSALVRLGSLGRRCAPSLAGWPIAFEQSNRWSVKWSAWRLDLSQVAALISLAVSRSAARAGERAVIGHRQKVPKAGSRKLVEVCPHIAGLLVAHAGEDHQPAVGSKFDRIEVRC